MNIIVCIKDFIILRSVKILCKIKKIKEYMELFMLSNSLININ